VPSLKSTHTQPLPLGSEASASSRANGISAQKIPGKEEQPSLTSKPMKSSQTQEEQEPGPLQAGLEPHSLEGGRPAHCCSSRLDRPPWVDWTLITRAQPWPLWQQCSVLPEAEFWWGEEGIGTQEKDLVWVPFRHV
jgi:hypothetical protein